MVGHMPPVVAVGPGFGQVEGGFATGWPVGVGVYAHGVDPTAEGAGMAESRFADHEDDPDEFADWDAYERTRGGRVPGSGIIPASPSRYGMTVSRSWSSRVDADVPAEFQGDRAELADPNPDYL
jgi:hypothetical protein